jgi:hypothetical protein
MKAHEEWRYSAFTLALDGDVWRASRPDRFTSGEINFSSQSTGDFVGTGAGLGAVERRRIYYPSRDSNPRPSIS